MKRQRSPQYRRRTALAPFLLIPLLLLFALSIGCARFSALVHRPTSEETLKASLDAATSNRTLEEFLVAASKEILSDPRRVEKLRGMSACVSVISLGDPEWKKVRPMIGSYRGARRMEAGELVALIYGAYYFAHSDTDPIRRNIDLRRMIAQMFDQRDYMTMNRVLDELTSTKSGPPLEGVEFEKFKKKREIMNRWLAAIGLHPPLRTGQKIWETTPHGRDIQLLGPSYANENIVASEAMAKLMLLVARRDLAPGKNRGALLKMLAMDPGEISANPLASSFDAGAPMYGFSDTRGDKTRDVLLYTSSEGLQFIVVVLTDRVEAGAEFAQRIGEKINAAIQAEELPIPRQRND